MIDNKKFYFSSIFHKEKYWQFYMMFIIANQIRFLLFFPSKYKENTIFDHKINRLGQNYKLHILFFCFWKNSFIIFNIYFLGILHPKISFSQAR